MKHLISYDDETDVIEIASTAGWRVPLGDELSALACAIDRPAPWWLDYGAIAAGLLACGIWLRGGGA